MTSEQQTKYKEIISEAEQSARKAHKELMELAHQQKVAYRVARMFTYKLQKSFVALKDEVQA
jgi:hypothetical protein